ncbi:MAG: hypothetical protein APF77_18995 [Clostridia bacterium BRH_c25]|nr:MAG: hypothetical protein APF77_18995 [Clostridia bacterium BRH_c25]
MPRPRKCRMVRFVPDNPCFHPQLRNAEEVVLNVEEVEAIRLSDFLSLDQDAAADSMDVSRGTFQRIINEARWKLADALVNGKIIRIEGGDYKVTSDKPCCKERGISCEGRRCSKSDICEGGK